MVVQMLRSMQSIQSLKYPFNQPKLISIMYTMAPIKQHTLIIKKMCHRNAKSGQQNHQVCTFCLVWTFILVENVLPGKEEQPWRAPL